MRSGINISSGHYDEFVSRFELDNETYQCSTENLARKCNIVTRIYLKGEIISTLTSDYTHMAKFPNLVEKLKTMMERQHKSAVETFIEKHSKPKKTRAHYAEEIRGRLRDGDGNASLGAAREALECFPSDPFFLSYCGYLMAVFEKKPREGTMMCEEAINILKKSGSADSVFFLPLFYLHLGRSYLKGDRKKAAIKAFQQGLKYERSDRDLLSEIRGLGTRKKPVVPFLKRSHPINKFLGKMRHRRQTAQ